MKTMYIWKFIGETYWWNERKKTLIRISGTFFLIYISSESTTSYLFKFFYSSERFSCFCALVYLFPAILMAIKSANRKFLFSNRERNHCQTESRSFHMHLHTNTHGFSSFTSSPSLLLLSMHDVNAWCMYICQAIWWRWRRNKLHQHTFGAPLSRPSSSQAPHTRPIFNLYSLIPGGLTSLKCARKREKALFSIQIIAMCTQEIIAPCAQNIFSFCSRCKNSTPKNTAASASSTSPLILHHYYSRRRRVRSARGDGGREKFCIKIQSTVEKHLAQKISNII